MDKRPLVPEMMSLVEAFYAKEGNGAGGVLHTVLDDGNLEDKHIHWCLRKAREERDDDAIRIAELLLDLTMSERQEIYAAGPYA